MGFLVAFCLVLSPFVWPLILIGLVSWGLVRHHGAEWQASRSRKARERARKHRARELAAAAPYVASRTSHRGIW